MIKLIVMIINFTNENYILEKFEGIISLLKIVPSLQLLSLLKDALYKVKCSPVVIGRVLSPVKFKQI